MDSKKGSGSVGLLTCDLIDRTAYYEHAMILAMAPFLREGLYTGAGAPE